MSRLRRFKWRVQRRYRDAIRRTVFFAMPRRPFITFEPWAYLDGASLHMDPDGVLVMELPEGATVKGLRCYDMRVRIGRNGKVLMNGCSLTARKRLAHPMVRIEARGPGSLFSASQFEAPIG